VAASLFNELADPTKAHAFSAVIAAMRERGIDLATIMPRRLTNDLASRATMPITMDMKCTESSATTGPSKTRRANPTTRPEDLR